MRSTSCSWCHTMVPETEPMCPECTHDAHVPRMHCRCHRCLSPEELRADLEAEGIDAEQAFARVLEALERRRAELREKGE